MEFDHNSLRRIGGKMWVATGHISADLSKTFSKKSLEIFLDTKILAPLMFLVFRKDKTPKALDFTGFSAFSIVG